jgi:Ser/Thr protein kinase RdoA (MazF antagonist)
LSTDLDRCRAAAVGVARAHGLEVSEAVPLPASSNVLLHLRPHPVVARVMTATVALHDDPEAWLRREVAVGTHLRARGAAATPPTRLLPPGPHREDGLWLTLWTLVEQTPGASDPSRPGTPTGLRPGTPDPRELGASLRALHDALDDYAGPELPPVAGIVAEVDGLLGGLRPEPWFGEERIRAARDELTVAGPRLDAGSGDRPIHGDASISNVLRTPAGLVWNDFEDACRGPVEWDVAGLLLDLRDHGATADDAAAFLAAYGPHRQDLVDALSGLHRLYAVAWHASRAATHPRSRRRLAEHLAADGRAPTG